MLIKWEERREHRDECMPSSDEQRARCKCIRDHRLTRSLAQPSVWVISTLTDNTRRRDDEAGYRLPWSHPYRRRYSGSCTSAGST